MLVPAHLIDGCSFRAGIEFASIKFFIQQSQPPGRLKEGRVVNPPEAAPTVTHLAGRPQDRSVPRDPSLPPGGVSGAERGVRLFEELRAAGYEGSYTQTPRASQASVVCPICPASSSAATISRSRRCRVDSGGIPRSDRLFAEDRAQYSRADTKRPILAGLNCGINDGSSFCGAQVLGKVLQRNQQAAIVCVFGHDAIHGWGCNKRVQIANRPGGRKWQARSPPHGRCPRRPRAGRRPAYVPYVRVLQWRASLPGLPPASSS